MKAIQLIRPRQFQLVETGQPEIGEQQILVRLQQAVLCGSDIPKFTGLWPGLHYPLPPGMPIHECVGAVVESRSPRFQPGDVVVAVPKGDRGWAELYAAEASRAVPIPDPLVGSEPSLLIQPLSTVVYALDRLGDVAGRSATVVGLGPIGLLVVWLLRHYGTARITGIDPIPGRCQVAQSLGAAHTLAVCSSQAAPSEPSDICVEAVGQQTQTINDCLRLVKRGGVVLAMGVPLQAVYPFEYERFFRQNIHLVASVTPPDETAMVRAADLLDRHGHELDGLITHRFPLQQLAEAYAMYETPANGHSLKVLVDATSW